jgi:Tol biopolymer transport system component
VTFLCYESVVPAGSNAQQQVYVRDATSGTTSLVSAGIGGALGDNVSFDSVISGDGKHVAFSSYASNLIPAGINGIVSIFVRDLESGETTCVSVNPSGQPSVSRDGRYVAFWSYASDLVPGGSGTYSQIYVRDLASGETTCASVTIGGALGTGHCWEPSISGDGRRVVFQSQANDLVAGDTNVKDDLFVRYLDGGLTTKISVTSTGAQFNRGSRDAVISDDGAHVAFITGAALTADDINGDVDIYVRHLDTLVAGGLGAQAVLPGPVTLLPITRVTDDTTVDYLGFEDSGVRLSISGDGRYVTYQAENNDDSRGDANSGKGDIHDIFMADTLNGTSRFVSMSAVPGVQTDGDSYDAVVSDDGKYVAFASWASNVVVGDENSAQDIFRAKVDVDPPKTASDGKPSYSGQALLTLTPTDFSGAGIKGTWFSLDGSSEITYTAPITVTGVGRYCGTSR